MADYEIEELRECFRSVMRKGSTYEREEILRSLARYLGFARLTDSQSRRPKIRHQQRHPPRYSWLRGQLDLEGGMTHTFQISHSEESC